MKFLGSFFNPEYAGEGFACDQDDTGRVVLHFFSYIKGAQFWLYAVGKRVGDVAILEAEAPFGGDLGNPVELKKVDRPIWGQITVTALDNGKIRALFEPADQTIEPWGYDAESAFTAVVPPVVVPPPVEPPLEPEPPPVVEPTTTLLLEKWLELGAKSKWVDMGPVPLHSSAPVYKSRIGNTSYMWTKNRITVTKGTLTITQVNVGGPDHPKMTGVSNGDVYQAGESFEIQLYVGPATATTGWKQSNYGIWAQEIGEFFRVSAQVMYEL